MSGARPRDLDSRVIFSALNPPPQGAPVTILEQDGACQGYSAKLHAMSFAAQVRCQRVPRFVLGITAKVEVCPLNRTDKGRNRIPPITSAEEVERWLGNDDVEGRGGSGASCLDTWAGRDGGSHPAKATALGRTEGCVGHGGNLRQEVCCVKACHHAAML